MSLLATKGFAAPRRRERAYIRNREQLCEASGETSRLWPLCQGLFNHHLVRGDVELARQLANRSPPPRTRGIPSISWPRITRLWGHLLGKFEKAAPSLEQAWRIDEQMPTRSLTSLTGADLRVFMRAYVLPCAEAPGFSGRRHEC